MSNEKVKIEYDNNDYGQWLTIGPAKISYPWNDEERELRAKADAVLIFEAFNVHNETGMTPASLQARIKELEKEIKQLKCLHVLTYVDEDSFQKCQTCDKIID